VCIEGEGVVAVDGKDYPMAFKDALYVGRGSKEIFFKSSNKEIPVKYYFASSPAHTAYPTVKIMKK
jgi:4-deoxy-L-threo-5-hexosulose-uronate ketol-isomerase